MSEDIFSRKLAAYLHDPADKPFILMQGVSHERRASELAEKLGVRVEDVEAADHIASAMERAFLPRGASRNQALQAKFLVEPCVKHPLSGRELEGVKSLKGADIRSFMDAADKAFEELSREQYADDKLRFLALWRNLKPLVAKHSGGVEGKFWALAPADTRMPDHSIFEHLKVASACARSGYADELLLSNSSLLLFSIRGVQRFIAEARKAQDLFWGSFLLSFLNWRVIERISDVYGPDCVIFPDIHGQPFADLWLEGKGIAVEDSVSRDLMIPTIPNRTLAIIPERDEGILRDLGAELDGQVKSRFRSIGEVVLEEFGLEMPSGFTEQLDKSLDTYWVFLPWFNDGEGRKAWEAAIDRLRSYFAAERMEEIRHIMDFVSQEGEYPPNIGNVYSILYSFCEKASGSLKNMNPFTQLAERGRKCSLCGERNVLFYKKTTDEGNRSEEQIKKSKLFNDDAVVFDAASSRVTLKYLQPGEGLCAVCFSKRCAEKYFRREFGKNAGVEFPSIAEVTLRKTTKELEGKEECQKAYQDYMQVFGEDFDPQLLYEENLNERFFEKNGLDAEKLDQAREAMDSLIKALNRKGLKLSKYYAVIKIDGDDMGKWLSGELAPFYGDIYHPSVWGALDAGFKEQLRDKKRSLTPAMHATISSALKDYSQVMVKELVTEKHDAYLIYAGGDDALALVNLEDLLSLMVKLRAAFSGHIDGKLEKVDFREDASGFVEREDGYLLTMGPTATASMGVCIAHYKTPLSMVLEAAREAEERAKSLPGKDAFCMTILKGSGERVETAWKWFFEGGAENIEPGGTVALLADFIDVLKGTKSEEGAGFSDRFVYKFKETFRRFSTEEKIANLDEMVASEIKRLLSRSYVAGGNKRDLKEKLVNKWTERLNTLYLNARGLDNFVSLLEAATFIAREP